MFNIIVIFCLFLLIYDSDFSVEELVMLFEFKVYSCPL